MSDAEYGLQEPRFPFRLSGNAEAESLRQEIARLKALVVQLSAIIVRSVAAEK
ncbi:MAG: hypothetical protein Q8M24_00105 [Pseudolabrys sp.]|nr:hypothetical protein [Pseudolabrys sp.]MDP2293850.1 hypothetical protein [Pseudolabrys sp.]